MQELYEKVLHNPVIKETMKTCDITLAVTVNTDYLAPTISTHSHDVTIFGGFPVSVSAKTSMFNF